MHGTVCPAVPVCTHHCTRTAVQPHVHAVLAPRQPCLPVRVLMARAKPRCAGMLGLEPQGASVPGAIHSLGMLKLASRQHVCFLYLPVMGRALGASLQFAQIIIRVVTKRGMSEKLSSRGADPEHTCTHARLKPGTGAVDSGSQSPPAALGCTGAHEHGVAHVWRSH